MNRTRYLLVVSIMINWVMGISYAGVHNQDIFSKLLHVKQTYPTFNIQLWMNKQSYQPGDLIEFSFKTDRDCYLTLIEAATEGVIRVIFPNKRSPDNFVIAGRTYKIPGDYNFALKIKGPPGIEKVKAIATINKMDIFDNLNNGDYFFFEGKPDNEIATSSLEGLAGKLKKHTWTETSLEFEIKKTDSSQQIKRGFGKNEGKPAPQPRPITGTLEHIKTRGFGGNEGRPAPQPLPGTGTTEHTR